MTTFIPISGHTGRLRIYFFADTHLQACRPEDPLLPEAWRQHPKPVLPRSSRELLRSHLDRAVSGNADLILVGGDLFHFPSKENARLARDLFQDCPVPIRSVPGNHDWFYPGQDGYEPLRDAQLPLLQPPLDVTPWVMETGGVRFVGVDNSTYFLSEAESRFLCDQLAQPGPVIVLLHIPPSTPELRAPVIRKHGGAILMQDPEGRTRDSIDPGPTRAAMQALQTSPNLKGILAAHVHLPFDGEFREQVPLLIPEAGYRDGYHWLEIMESIGPAPQSV
jgi:3',5'-cyclic AMP phosphodiesterase CpdA